jgi:hypothetical protein
VDPIALGIIAAVVPIVLALLGRGASARVQPGELRYSRGLRWFSLLIGLLPSLAVVTIVLFVQKRPLRPDERLPVVLLIAMFPAIALFMVLEFFRVRHRYDDSGLTFQSPWSKYRRIAWADVASARWRPMWKSLDLKTHAGVTVHLSPWLAGLRPFADVALARIPPVVLTANPQARTVLLLMSAGVSGELMMSPLTPEKLLELRVPRVSVVTHRSE